MQKYTPLEGNKTNVVNTAQAMMGLIMGGQVSENSTNTNLNDIYRFAKHLVPIVLY